MEDVAGAAGVADKAGVAGAAGEEPILTVRTQPLPLLRRLSTAGPTECPRIRLRNTTRTCACILSQDTSMTPPSTIRWAVSKLDDVGIYVQLSTLVKILMIRFILITTPFLIILT